MAGALDTSVDRVALARELAADFATRAAGHDRDRSFPFENFEKLRDACLLNLTVPTEYGGDGLGLTETARVVAEVAGGDSSTGLVLGMHYLKHAGVARERNWPETIHRLLCEESVNGIALLNSLRVEPDLGTVSRGGVFATTATKTDNGWRLNGRKIYSTGSPMLRWMDVAATTEGSDQCVGVFLVRGDTPGVRIERTWDHIGLRASGSDDVVFEDAEVPDAFAVDFQPVDRQRTLPLTGSAWGSAIVSAVYLGVARAARDWLAGYLHERKPTNLGASLATVPRIQTVVGEIESLIYASEHLLWGMTARVDAGEPLGANTASAFVKLHVTNNAVRATELGMNLIGNPGLSRNNPIERHYRDALCGRIHWPQDDATLLMGGKEVLDASAPG